MSIKCYVSGCQNPVVGQCKGYPDGCGKFYCEQHTQANLCVECGQELELDQLANEYEGLANGLKWNVFKATVKHLLVPVPVILAISLCVSVVSDGQNLCAAPWIWLFIAFVIANWRADRTIMRQYEQSHPGFQLFYKEWKKHKWNRDLRKAIAAGIEIGMKL